MSDLSAELTARRDRLLHVVGSYESCAVALSGGVDSAVVSQAAQLALGERAVAVTAVSASLAAGELDAARSVAAHIGIRHEVVHTEELDRPDYVRNAADRCYHCKTELYDVMGPLAERLGVAVIANGANADDAGDWRPGMKAAGEHRVRSPLLECGLTKDDVRALARHWNLPVADKPASPCLSSRIAYGEEVTPERLRMIDAAEQFLRAHGFTTLRVRYHRGDVARVEVPAAEVARLAEPPLRTALVEKLRELGFRYVTLDLEGFRSGSQNEVLPVESLLASSTPESRT